MQLVRNEFYPKVLESLDQIPINTLFARAVLENKVNGQVFAENAENPSTFYVIHPYGMTFLFGDPTNSLFNESFRKHALNANGNRNHHEWMQTFPPTWDAVLGSLFKDKLIASAENKSGQEQGVIEMNTRVNFRFSATLFQSRKKDTPKSGVKIVRTDGQIFSDMPGSVVPSLFWKDDEHFLKNGIGFSLFCNDRLASTAYSSCIHKNQLELGIETVAEFRGMGFAEQVCAALIEYCIEHKYEPIWACRLENTGSYKLAQKLGFTPTTETPYYRLSK